MKVTIIQSYQLDTEGIPIRYKKMFIPFLTTLTLAGMTPSGVDIKLIDASVDDIDYDEKTDLVAITAQTAQITGAYKISGEFRKRGIKTIVGGIHASMCPEEAALHFDAVCIGEAEDLWEEILNDARNKNLKRLYKAQAHPDLSKLALPRFDLLNMKKYLIPPMARTPLLPIQATRGCPHKCSFCAVNVYMGNRIRKKPIAHVLKEIEFANPSRFVFVDDNIAADPAYSRELFKALIPMKLRWACQMSTTIRNHPDLIELAAEAGCHENFMGIESISADTLKYINKGFNPTEDYKELFRKLKEVGILPQIAFIFGLDTDTIESIKHTMDVMMQWDINYVYINLLAPLPGTVLREQLEKEGRVIEKDWARYDGSWITVNPKNMTADELINLYWEAYERFYTLGNAFRKVWRFRKEYVKFFPRDNAIEELFFSIGDYLAVRKQNQPFTLGLRI